VIGGRRSGVKSGFGEEGGWGKGEEGRNKVVVPSRRQKGKRKKKLGEDHCERMKRRNSCSTLFDLVREGPNAESVWEKKDCRNCENGSLRALMARRRGTPLRKERIDRGLEFV